MKKAWKQPPQTRFNAEKFRALAHMFSTARPEFDAQTIMHCMWQCEQQAYLRLGRTITGAIWVRGDEYPIPCRSKAEVKALARNT